MNNAHGMVTGWPDQSKTTFYFFIQNGLSDGLGAPRADQMGFGRHRRDIGNAKMNALNVLNRAQTRLEFINALNVKNTLFKNLVLGV